MKTSTLEIDVHRGDVIALVAPDGSRRRYLCSTLATAGGVRYELSDHVEGSPPYDEMLNDRTVLVLKWVDAGA